MKISIVIQLQIEGFHRWISAPAEMAFLRAKHRHIFWITCKKEVRHENRAIEFILAKRTIKKQYPEPFDFGGDSCEAIARDLLNLFGFDSVVVLEDGENGAEVTA